MVRTTVPKWWPPPDPILGFRPQPNSEVVATATFGPELIYRRTYHFDADAARLTPQGPAGADTYLFLGDSFIFGQGLFDIRPCGEMTIVEVTTGPGWNGMRGCWNRCSRISMSAATSSKSARGRW